MAINFRSNTVIKNLSIGPTVGPPIVNLFSNQTEINESATVTFSITTENIEAGTLIPYSISGVTTTDISPSPLSGNFVVGTTETISITAVNDENTDGDKTMVMTLPSNGNLTASCIVRDTSQTPPPVVNLASNQTEINESGTVTFSITTENIEAGTLIPYSISGVTTTDISPSPLSGNFVVGTTETISITAVNDEDTDGDKTMVMTLPSNGNLTASCIVRDTSQTPSGPSYLAVGAFRQYSRGTVSLYNLSNLSGTPTTFTGPTQHDSLGYSVALNSNYLLAGALGEDARVGDGGGIYVYDINNLSSSPTVLAPSGLTSSDSLGMSLAATDNYIVAGTMYDDSVVSYGGAVYVWDATNLSSAPTKLVPSDIATFDYFGHKVAIAGDTLVASSERDNSQAGSVYVYDASNLSLAPTKLSPAGLEAQDNFGHSVAVTSNHIVVGAYGDDDQGYVAGAVYVYDVNNLSAAPTKLTPSGIGESDLFGFSVAATSNYIVVGARGDDDIQTNAGAMYVYDATNLSAAPTKVAPSDLTATAEFSAAVEVRGSYIAATALEDNGGVGAVYVYDATDLSATPTKIVPTGSPTNTEFGSSIALG